MEYKDIDQGSANYTLERLFMIKHSLEIKSTFIKWFLQHISVILCLDLYTDKKNSIYDSNFNDDRK